MYYSVETKKQVVKLVQQGMTIRAASRIYGIDRKALGKWVKYPEKYLVEKPAGCRPYSIVEKLEVLQLAEENQLSARQIAGLKKINYHTVSDWIRDKEHILALYSSQGHSSLNTVVTTKNSPGKEASAVCAANDKDTKQHIRDLKKENEFLKAKVAYLEALMELNGTPVSGFKKKLNIKPSTESSEEASET